MSLPDLATLLAPAHDDMRAVNALIERHLASDIDTIGQLAGHIIGGGGKRLRPVTAILAAQCCGGTGSVSHTLAVVIEFIHTATLLHDDVVDASDLRRGRPTANSQFGNALSVLVGDFLYSRAFQLMVQLRDMRVMETLASATNVIAEGEVMQAANRHNPDLSEARYLDVVRRKTATLFEAAAQGGALLAGADQPEVAALTQFGREFGMAYQLVDDLLDYTGDAAALGKNLGDDLAQGSATLPLIHALRHGAAAQQALIRDALHAGSDADFAAVRLAIESTGSIAYTAALARRHAQAAHRALDLLPGSDARAALQGLVRYAVERDH